MRFDRCRGLCVAALAVLWACSGGERTVGRLEVEPRALTLGYPEFSTVHLTFHPTVSLEELGAQPTVFVHLLDEPGSVLRTFDHPLPAAWKPGNPLAYDLRIYQSALADPLAPRSYLLTVGLYDVRGKRFRLEAAGEEVDRGEYQVATVEVPVVPSTLPHVRFSERWNPVEPGSDRQVLARRWLQEGEGSIQIENLPGAGTLWLTLKIPAPDPAAGRLELAAGAEAPSLRVDSTCSGVEVNLTGPGTHLVEIPVSAAAAASCEMRLLPNYRIAWADAPLWGAVALENLAWSR